MPLITTYATLQSEVLSWLNRTGDTEATSKVPNWIQLAEDEIAAELAVSPLRQGETVNSSFTINSQYTALPSGFINIRTIEIQGNPNTELDIVSPQVLARKTSLTQLNGKPQVAAIQGNQLRVSPTPDSGYTGIFTHQGFTNLSDSNTSNWLLLSHPKIYLYATMAEADRFYRDAAGYEADSAVWKGLFAKAYAGSGPSASGGPLQMRPNGSTP